MIHPGVFKLGLDEPQGLQTEESLSCLTCNRLNLTSAFLLDSYRFRLQREK